MSPLPPSLPPPGAPLQSAELIKCVVRLSRAAGLVTAQPAPNTILAFKMPTYRDSPVQTVYTDRPSSSLV